MTLRNFLLPTGILALIATHASAQLPYNPTRILLSQNGSSAYIFAPQASSSQFQLRFLNTSGTVTTGKPTTSTLYSTLPFLSSSNYNAFTPTLSDEGDITVLSGDCINGGSGPDLWRFVGNESNGSGMWSRLSLSQGEQSLNANFLSAGLSFSPTASADDAAFYIFGGMCPNSTSLLTSSDWTTNANYSNNMLTITPDASSSSTPVSISYDLSISAARGAPIAEAGLTITPLVPTTSNTSAETISQQQNFVLLGGHTQQAFINMSQVALFSLPEASWSFLGVDQPSTANANVEPRSGHTAVLTPDGNKIIVFGGWVGDVSTPADPQLAVLEVGQGYGGTGDWSWTVPSQTSNPFSTGQGIYGHGAVMLPGGVMMISGGYGISGYSPSRNKRQSASAQTANGQLLLFNTTSSSWISTYTNPSSPNSPAYTGVTSASSSGVLKTTSQKAGLGAGLALGFVAVVTILIILFFYSRRLKQRQILRERELRDLALGVERHNSESVVDDGPDQRGGGTYPEMRTASWGSRQERHIGTGLSHEDDNFSWTPTMGQEQVGILGIAGEKPRGCGMNMDNAERTGLLLEIPSPTRGLRKSLHSRGPNGYNTGVRPPSITGGFMGGIHRIDEAEDEGSQPGSLKRKAAMTDVTPMEEADRRSTHSDPFKDPELQPRAPSPSSAAKKQREQEVQGWVDDWSVAAAAMDRGDLSRNTSTVGSHRRTHSNLSEEKYSQNVAANPGRGSPEKSDRTGSNLSESSNFSVASIQRSVLGIGSLSRNVSQRSASAGYAIISGAASAVAAKVMGGGSASAAAEEPSSEGVARALSKRSASLNTNSVSSSTRYGGSRYNRDTFTTARTSHVPLHSAEDEALLNRASRAGYGGLLREKDNWATPPESPVKERHHPPSMRPREGSLGHAARGLLGSVKRVFTGTDSVGVQNRVAEFENRSEHNSPTKEEPEMTEVGGGSRPGDPSRSTSASAVFLKAQRGAKDWNEYNPTSPGVGPSAVKKPRSPMIIKRKPLPEQQVKVVDMEVREDDDAEDDDWDVEAAVERRVVQVMFTVPKEKLRVVNADALSLLSKSDVEFEGGENDGGGGGERDQGGGGGGGEENKRVSVVPEEAEDELRDAEVGKGKGKEVVRER